MKRILIIVFLLASILASSQVYTEVNIGDWVVTTVKGDSDIVQKATRHYWTYTGTGALIADTVFYIPSTAPEDTVATLMTAAANHGRAAILFQRGRSKSTTITVSQDSLVFGSYGSGANPIISGFTTVTDWTDLGGNIWESTNAVSTLDSLNIVLVNGVNTPMGRTPNNGIFYTIDSVDNYVYITSSELTGTPDYTGARLVMRKNGWTWQVAEITNQSIDTLYYTEIHPKVTDSQYDAKTDMGFFIQADSSTLDQQNEWYYNTSTKKLQIYSTIEPVNVQVPTLNRLLTVNGKDNITFKNIEFSGANERCIYAQLNDNLIFDNCEINNNGLYGIYSYDNDNLTIKNSSFSGNNWNSIFDWGGVKSTNTTITNNTINNTLLNIGIEGASDCVNAIHTNSDSILVQYNTIVNSGWGGIKFDSEGGQVLNNFVDSCLLNRSDGGAIYTGDNSGRASVISENIVTNAIGYPTGHYTEQVGARGIYLDIKTSNITISNNIIAHCFDGVNIASGSYDNIIEGNLIFNNTEAALFMYNIKAIATGYGPGTTVDNIFKNNQITTLATGQRLMFTRSIYTDIDGFFSESDSNIFASPITEQQTISVYEDTIIGKQATFNVSGWKAWSGLDAESSFFPYSVNSEDSIQLFYNETKAVKTFSLTETGLDLEGNTFSTSFDLEPYTGKVLLFNYDTLLPPVIDTIGYPTIYATSATPTVRYAQPVYITEDCWIDSISMYHGAGGAGSLLLYGIYDTKAGVPDSLRAITSETTTATSLGWQTVALIEPYYATAGDTVNLSFVYYLTPSIYYTTATPSRFSSSGNWTARLPDVFGTGITGSTQWSIAAIVRKY